MSCLDESTILGFLRGDLPDEALAEAEGHLDECHDCRELVSALAQASPSIEFTHTAAMPTSSLSAPGGTASGEALRRWTEQEPLTRGETVGRYLVLRSIGAGGMGVVYAAHDPELDRTVALKLLRAGTFEGSMGTAWLMREAQAMARVSHPNVVGVHDVGVYRGQVFVAMEYVDGITLREWLEKDHSWQEKVEVFIAAGRGLEAAHEGGLVHRDFKPSNVLIDKKGRVRVVDFGLARAVASSEPDPDLNTAAPSSVSQTKLSRSGAVVGTPAYMAPEQHSGGSADPRTDQFSFCLAFFEALYGQRPFQGDTERDLQVAKEQGRIAEAPKGSKVPAWLARIVARGLSPDRDARFGSMRDLLAALSTDRRAKRRRLLVAVVIGAATAAAAIAAYQSGERQTCTGAERKLEGIWDGARRAAIHESFRATGLSYAEAVWRRTRDRLERYTRRWVTLRTDACEATRVRGEQSEAALDLRMQCFRRQLLDLAALARVLASADKEVVRQSIQAVSDLGDPSACGDLARLRKQIQPPRDAQTRRRVEALRPELTEVRARLRAGRYADGLRRIRALEKKVSAVAYRPMEAEAALLRGLLEEKGGDPAVGERFLLKAFLAAQASSRDRIVAHAAQKLLELRGYRLGKIKAAQEWVPHAVAAAERLGRSSSAWADMVHGLGQLHFLTGDYAKAVVKIREALQIRTRLLGADHPLTGDGHSDLGLVLWKMARYKESETHLRRALKLRSKVLGAEHPDVAIALNNLGLLSWSRGRNEESIQLHRRSLALRRKALGDAHPDVALALGNLGLALRAAGREDEALEVQKRALAIREKALGPRSEDVALSAHNVGILLAGLGRYREALHYLERAHAIRAKLLGPEHPNVAKTLRGLGQALAGLGRKRESQKALRRALAISLKRLGAGHSFTSLVRSTLGFSLAASGDFEKALRQHRLAFEVARRKHGAKHPWAATALLGEGEALSGMRRFKEALRPLTKAKETFEARRRPLRKLGRARFALARATWNAGSKAERRRSIGLAEASLDAFRRAGAGGASWVGRVSTWLKKRGAEPKQ